MYKIAVIGDRDSVLGFCALGLEAYGVTDVESAKVKLKELAKEEYAVIYLTETLARDMEDVIDRYKKNLRPAIILIPGREGPLGIGMRNIQQAIEQAVGSDIL